ncbi:uncharacterized protein LOC132637671 [Lycium barbarum]|uniref:uncharacterized protein LOC132637671 n=1 Tax=Lycium barbarum TaxID=112863 RepID=UPI00293F06C4|nr:uncharacterized protein LOC132637671 [Lycium barbarum]
METELKPSKDQYRPYSQLDRFSFRMDRGRIGHNHNVVKRILIDPGSSVNIIRWKVVEQLGLLDQIVPKARVLNRFNMACETTKGEITLSVNTAGIVQHRRFYVIDGEMRYNAMFDRPWVHNMRAVLSTFHQMMKFPTLNGIKTIHVEQQATKEMFAVEEAVLAPKSTTPRDTEDLNKGKDTK